MAALFVAAVLVVIDLAGGGPRPAEPGRPVAGPVARPAPRAVPVPAPGRAPGAMPAPSVWPAPGAGHPLLSTAPLLSISPATGAVEPPPGVAPGGRARLGGSAKFPVTGAGTFDFATGAGAVLGRRGVLRRFRVAVENGTGQDVSAFGAAVERTLADRRGWTASGRLRLQRVPRNTAAQFTVYLASPGTSERMCAVGGLRTERFTNCRLPGRVIINLARWWHAVPGYRAPLAEYRAYAVNHEVGHQLGFGHQACPGRGRLAPVMQQQTLGLRGCRANGWPFVNGRRYVGPGIP